METKKEKILPAPGLAAGALKLIIGEDMFNDTTREQLTTNQIVDASDRINNKVYAETGKKEFIRIIKRQDIQLNPDF